MTTTAAPRRDTDTGESVGARRRRGAVLLVGAVALAVLFPPVGSVAFSWLPAVTGLAYLGAAAASGTRGALWAPGLVVLGFGVASVLSLGGTFSPDSLLALTLLGVGGGGLVAVALSRVGVHVSALSIAVTVTVLGAFVLLTTRIAPDGIGGEALLYAALLAGWGVWEMRPASTS